MILVAIALLAGRPLVAEAHPLGNFTINHEADIVVRPDGVLVGYVLDLAEIPTFQLRDALASDPAAACAGLSRSIGVRVGASALPLAVAGARAAFAPGQGGLETLRLECDLSAPWPSGELAPSRELVVSDDVYPERIGWREMTARGEGVAIETALPRQSASARLTAYPKEALSSAPDVREGRVRIASTAAASPSAMSPIAAPVATTSDVLASLLERSDLGSLGPALALLLAFALGALHAATPGHGKTVMAAYLVATRRSSRQAIVLGLTVAVSHTAGVVGLALIVLLGSRTLPPERVYPLLSAGSALIVLGLGVAMSWRALRRHAHGDHDHAHAPASGPRALVALGLAGGLVPSASAVVLLLAAIATRHTELGVVLVLAFGLGMAAMLVGVGLALVAATRAIARMRIVPRAVAYAPAFAAVVVLLFGIGLTAQSLAALL